MWVFEGRGDDVFFQERYFGYDLGPSSHPRWVSGVEPNPGSCHDLGPSSHPRWVSGAEPNPGSCPDLGPSSHPRWVSGVEPNLGSFPDLGPSSYPRWVSGVEPNPGSNAGQIQLSHINRHTYLAKEKRHLSQVPFHFI